MTAALVMGPKIPSEVMFSLVCRHFTWSPVLPCLKVRVMVQVVGSLCEGLVGLVKVVHGNPVTEL